MKHRKPDQSAISSGRMTLKHFIDPMKITSPRWTRTHPKKLSQSPVPLITDLIGSDGHVIRCV